MSLSGTLQGYVSRQRCRQKRTTPSDQTVTTAPLVSSVSAMQVPVVAVTASPVVATSVNAIPLSAPAPLTKQQLTRSVKGRPSGGRGTTAWDIAMEDFGSKMAGTKWHRDVEARIPLTSATCYRHFAQAGSRKDKHQCQQGISSLEAGLGS